jgi:glucuronosyltransferase
MFIKILFDSYIENALHMSRIFRDRPQSALDTAIFWTEYVIRHGGAPHLQSAAVKLAWHQYLLIDVITLMLGSVLIFLLAARKLFRMLFGSKNVPKKKDKQH